MPHGRCPCCASPHRVTRLRCGDRGLGLEGAFDTPRLARLEPELRQFVELFVLASGSLKQTGALLGVSYPTVRSRLDRLIARVRGEQQHDDAREQGILDYVEAGRIPPKQGMRPIETV